MVKSIIMVLASAACFVTPHISRECRVTGGDSAAREMATTECQYARARFIELFGTAPDADIVLSDSMRLSIDFGQRGPVLTYPGPNQWMRMDSMLRRGDRLAGSRARETFLLAHEIGHLLLINWYYGHERPQTLPTYGTPLPDWFDEAVAVWSEHDDERQDRRVAAQEYATKDLALAELLTSTHPTMHLQRENPAPVFTETVVRTEKCNGFCVLERDTVIMIRKQYADGTITVDTLPPHVSADGVSEMNRFYALAGTLLPFLRERGGSVAMRMVIDRMRRGVAPHEVVERLPGLPPDNAAIEAEWRAWLVDIRSEDERTDAPAVTGGSNAVPARPRRP